MSWTKNLVDPPRGPSGAERPIQILSQARVYASTNRDAGKSDTVVKSTLSILGHYALMLFDLGSTHSFISVPFVNQLVFELELLLYVLTVSSPAGVDLVVKDIVRDEQVIVVAQP